MGLYDCIVHLAGLHRALGGDKHSLIFLFRKGIRCVYQDTLNVRTISLFLDGGGRCVRVD